MEAPSDIVLQGSLRRGEAGRLLARVDGELAVRRQIRLERCAGAARAAASRDFERGCAEALSGRPLRAGAAPSAAWMNGYLAGRGFR